MTYFKKKKQNKQIPWKELPSSLILTKKEAQQLATNFHSLGIHSLGKFFDKATKAMNSTKTNKNKEKRNG